MKEKVLSILKKENLNFNQIYFSLNKELKDSNKNKDVLSTSDTHHQSQDYNNSPVPPPLDKKINKYELNLCLKDLTDQQQIACHQDIYYYLQSLPKITGEIKLLNNKKILKFSSNEAIIINNDVYLENEQVNAFLIKKEDKYFAFVDQVLSSSPMLIVGQADNNQFIPWERGFNNLTLALPENFNANQNLFYSCLISRKNNNFNLSSFQPISDIEQNNFASILAKERYALEENIASYQVKQSIDDNNYKDLTDLAFITIDGPSTKDIDDAVYAFFDGHLAKIYVAIADPSSVVSLNSPLDVNARKLASSSYFPHLVIPMLPRPLSEEACSLKENEIRPSLVMEASFKLEDGNWHLLNSQIFNAKIKSKWRSTYQEINNILTGINIPDKATPEIINSILILNQYAKFCQNNETSLFDNKEIIFKLNAAGKISHLETSIRTPADLLVEKAMILANVEAARFLSQHGFGQGLFRNQYSPEIDLENELSEEEKSAALKRLLRPAFYDRENIGHFSLQKRYYTHFTSPIRRYADLMVHRLLKSIINNQPPPYKQQEIKDITALINIQLQKIKMATNKAKNILLNEYAQQFINQPLTAKIIEVMPAGYLIQTENLLEGFIPKFMGEYDLHQSLNVKIESVDYANEKIKFVVDGYTKKNKP